MKTLAESFVVAYEGSSPSSKLGTFESLNVNALKAVKSTIAVGFVAFGVFAGTAVQAETVQKALSYGDRGLVVAALQSKLGGIAVDGIFGSQTLTKLKSYQAVNKLAVDGVATKETLASLGTPNLSQAAFQPEQYGKLKLINNTENSVIVFLHAPGEETYNRYAYIPACSERIMSSQYSTKWRVSFDAKNPQQIEGSKGGLLVVESSKLMGRSDDTACNKALRLHARQIAANLINSPHDYANESRATYRPVEVLRTTLALVFQQGGKDLGEVIVATSSKSMNKLSKAERTPLLMGKKLGVNKTVLYVVQEVLGSTGRKVNVKDKQELIEVAKFLKGDGLDLDTAAQRLETYIKNCFPAFANKIDAREFLKFLQKADYVTSNLDDKMGSILVADTDLSGMRDLNNSQPIKSVADLNNRIVPAPGGQRQYSSITGIGGEKLKCVQDKPSAGKHPSSSI